MNDFHSNFQECFTEEERESEIYRILATIGVNVEKAIYEEINAEIRRSTEAMAFTDQKIRSWLASLLMPVRNVISASGTGRVEVVSGIGNLPVPAGTVIHGKNGEDYQIKENLFFNGTGESSVFSFIQGTQQVHNDSYSEFISIPDQSEGIDLSDIKVKIGLGDEIPLAPPFPDPDDFHKGVSVRPRGGFFPFIHNNVLYIKIYPDLDPELESGVPIPDGRPVTVTFRVSKGASGNIGTDQFEDLQLSNASSQQFTLRFTNNAAMNGVNPPSHAELVNLLRRRLYASTHVSSVPEYTAWFLSQPGIGDCLVVSDYDRWRNSGDLAFSGSNITGVVEVYLLNSEGEIIDPKDGVGARIQYIKDLDAKLDSARDIAFVEYTKPSVFWHYYVIQFRSAPDEAGFTTSAGNALKRIYSVGWAQGNNTSLFKDLDMEKVTEAVRGDCSPIGLRVVPYHYAEFEIGKGGSAFNPTQNFKYFFGEKPGGWYEFYRYSGSNLLDEVEPFAVFREFLDVAGNTCSIYRYKKNRKYVNGQSYGWDWSELFGDLNTSYFGYRTASGTVNFNFANLGPGVLRCFWAIANEGMMPVGGELSREYGVRRLPSQSSGELNFLENVYFEKCL